MYIKKRRPVTGDRAAIQMEKQNKAYKKERRKYENHEIKKEDHR